MITGEMKNSVDRVWEIFWTGGVTNPLTVIEQFTYLLFIKGLDDRQNDLEANAALLGIEADRIFGPDQQALRWSHFRQLPASISSTVAWRFSMNGHKEAQKARKFPPQIFVLLVPLCGHFF